MPRFLASATTDEPSTVPLQTLDISDTSTPEVPLATMPVNSSGNGPDISSTAMNGVIPFGNNATAFVLSAGTDAENEAIVYSLYNAYPIAGTDGDIVGYFMNTISTGFFALGANTLPSAWETAYGASTILISKSVTVAGSFWVATGGTSGAIGTGGGGSCMFCQDRMGASHAIVDCTRATNATHTTIVGTGIG